MITVEKACELAKAEMKDLCICSCLDIGDRYAFSFCTDEGDLIPGTPIICISKKDGRSSWFSIPPLDNLSILQEGKEVVIPCIEKKICHG